MGDALRGFESLGDACRERVGCLRVPLRVGVGCPSVEDRHQFLHALLVGRGRLLGVGEAAQPVRHEGCKRRVHCKGQRLSRVSPRFELDGELDVTHADPAGAGQLLDDVAAVRHARLERHSGRGCDGRCRCAVPRARQRKRANRLEPVFWIVEHRMHRATSDGLLNDKVRGPFERPQRLLVKVVADDPEQRDIGGPRPAVALGYQLAADTQPQPRKVRVGEEPLDAAARVVAHLEQCVDTALTKVVDVPRLEVRAGRQRSRCHVHGIPAVVVEDNKLGRAAGEQPLTRGSDVGFQPRLSRLPVLRQTPEDLTHAPELRRALHVHADRNEHSVAS